MRFFDQQPDIHKVSVPEIDIFQELCRQSKYINIK